MNTYLFKVNGMNYFEMDTNMELVSHPPMMQRRNSLPNLQELASQYCLCGLSGTDYTSELPDCMNHIAYCHQDSTITSGSSPKFEGIDNYAFAGDSGINENNGTKTVKFDEH